MFLFTYEPDTYEVCWWLLQHIPFSVRCQTAGAMAACSCTVHATKRDTMPNVAWQRMPGTWLETSVDSDGQRQYRAFYRVGHNKRRTGAPSSPEEALAAREAKLKELHAQGQEPQHKPGHQHQEACGYRQAHTTPTSKGQSSSDRYAPYPQPKHSAPAMQGHAGPPPTLCHAGTSREQSRSHERLTADKQEHLPRRVMNINSKDGACMPQISTQHLNSLAAPPPQTAPGVTTQEEQRLVPQLDVQMSLKAGLQTEQDADIGCYSPTDPPLEPEGSLPSSRLFMSSKQGAVSLDQHQATDLSGGDCHGCNKLGFGTPAATARAEVDAAVPNDSLPPLPARLGGCVVQLTEVYDERLLAHGCTEFCILRSLAAGSHGSVHLGYTSLDGKCTAPQGQPISSSATGSCSCDTAAYDCQGVSAGISEDQQQTSTRGKHGRVFHAAIKVFRSASADFAREHDTLQLLIGKGGFLQLLAVGFVTAPSSQQQGEQQPVKEQAYTFPCLVLQLAERTLEDIDEPCTEQQAKKWTRQLLEGLAILHSGKLAANGTMIVHRDVKPLNLLLDDSGDLMIADFSSSAVVKSTTSDVSGGAIGKHWPRMASIAGSECYMAPEVGNPIFGGDYDRTVDSHAAGMVALGLLLGGRKQLMKHAKQLPLGVSAQPLSVMNFVWDIILGHEVPTLPFSRGFRRFLSCTCTPKCRQTPEELLQHPWVAQ